MDQVQSGSEDAAEVLYERYAGRLFGLARGQMSGTVRSLSDPEDIVQSAFRSLFRGVSEGTFQAPEGRSIWNLLAVIAVNKVRRRSSRNRSVQAMTSVSSGDETSGPIDAQAGPSPEQMDTALRESLEHLESSDQAIAMLRLQGYQVDEIAEQLGRSVRTIERALQRIREQLSDRISGLTADEPGL